MSPSLRLPSNFRGGFTVTVSVGKEIPHPNTTEHHIRWIKLFFKGEGENFPLR